MENELVQNAILLPSRTILRRTLEPIKLLPLLVNLPFFTELHLPQSVAISIARSIEIHIVPPLQKLIIETRQSSTPSPNSSPTPHSNNLQPSICPSKDLAFIVLQANTTEMVDQTGTTTLCTFCQGDTVGAIPERHVFSEFINSYSRTTDNNKKNVVLLAFPALLLRNGVKGGIEKISWQQNAWIAMLNTQHQNKQSNNIATAVIAGLIRPLMLKIAPRRKDLKQLVPHLKVVTATSTTSNNTSTIIYDDNHNRPKSKERQWFVVARGQVSLKTFENEEIIRDRHHSNQKKKRRKSLSMSTTTRSSSPIEKEKSSVLCNAGDTFGAWSSNDTRRFTVKTMTKDTVVISMSEMHVDVLLKPLVIRSILLSRNFRTIIESHLNKKHERRLDYSQLYQLGRCLPFIRDLSTSIRK